MPVSVAVIGAGERGFGFGKLVASSGGVVWGVAEPQDDRREGFATFHKLPPERCFKDWKELLDGPKRCDAVVVATLDRQHTEPAVAALAKGYHLLLEKPMATSLEECQAIAAAARKSGSLTAVCHSLRYHQGFSKVREILRSGAIGKLASFDQLEQVAYWHQAHSFVRGNWGNQSRATFMLMAKSCHDIDYMADLAGKPCLRVSSAGSLMYFNQDNAPEGAGERCVDCKIEKDCPYSALKWYVDCEDRTTWPHSVPSLDHSREAHLAAVSKGPYGRCVWRCDNDVVDHQQVLMEFEGGCTATFTMTGFTRDSGRTMRLHGTEGEIYYEEEKGEIVVKTFKNHGGETVKLAHEEGGHGGGDNRVVKSWLQAISEKNPKLILTDAEASLRTHAIVFAAEKSRLEKRTVAVSEMG